MAEGRMLGIIGCEVMEDEIAHVVANDQEARHVLVIDCDKDYSMARKISALAPDKEVLRITEADLGAPRLLSGLAVVVWVKPIGLHQSPPLLRQSAVDAMKRLEPMVQSILLFYGMCGKAFQNLDKVTQGVMVPVSTITDENDRMTDDCTCVLLGGTNHYRNFLVSEPGVYVLNSMWAAHWREYMYETQMLHDPNDIEEAKIIFQYLEYKKVCMLQTGLGDQATFRRQIEEFASLFGLQLVERKCTLSLVERAYGNAKARMRN